MLSLQQLLKYYQNMPAVEFIFSNFIVIRATVFYLGFLINPYLEWV